jgi:hypothetical protein
MDREQFDALTRLAATRGSRRAAIGALLGSVLVSQDALAKGGKHHHHKGNKPPRPRICYPGDKCVPGTAHTNTQCDFSNSDVFVGLDAQSSNLSGSNFTNADLRGADLRAVNLSDSCLVNADLRDAIIDESTNFHRVLFCNTTMPDGSVLNAGCERNRRCCPIVPPPCGPNSGCLGGPCDNAGDCFCVSSVEGVGACVSDFFANCDAEPCESSDDCPNGGLCVDVTSEQCCGGSPSSAVCFPPQSICGVGIAVASGRRSSRAGWRNSASSR